MKTDSARSDEVTWQVAFFALMPLALSAMTQTVGRVLDAPPELSFWLRSSPLVCAVDVLYFLYRVAAGYVSTPAWSLAPFRAELEYRFSDTDWTWDSRPEFEKAALGRWILLLLGGIPCQTIKLMAMRGIPVTQVMALVYFTALIFGETVNISAELTLRHRPGAPTPEPPESDRDDDRGAAWLGDTLLGVCHYWGYMTFNFLWAMPNFAVAARDSKMNEFLDGLSSEQQLLWPFPHTGWLLLTSGFSAALWSVVFSSKTRRGGDTDSLLIFYSILVPGCLWTGPAPQPEEGRGAAMVSILLIGGALCLSIITAMLTLKLLRMASGSRIGRVLGFPSGASVEEHLVLFLLNLSFTLATYAYGFDETGTINPTWVGVFG